jgi:GDSL-like Lipase/Acylhydrolase family/N-terminus of Esterase_SGNH_hydro-type
MSHFMNRQLICSFFTLFLFMILGVGYAKDSATATQKKTVEKGTSAKKSDKKVPDKKVSDKDAEDEGPTLSWHSLTDLGIEGSGWVETDEPYVRLPRRAKEKVRPAVWSLSRHSSGVCTRFVTDSSEIHAKWKLKSKRLGFPHMPPTGVSGVDLYVRMDNGRWRWVKNGKPDAQETTTLIIKNIPEGEREFLLYLPLYNGVNSISIGILESANIKHAPAYEGKKKKPILFYGTSITHGACASRPGMVHTAMLGRRFDWPVINLGFSGNGRMELEVVEFINEIDAAVYVIDCLPNLRPQEVKERTIPLVKKIREKHPDTPILLVEDRNYPNGFLIESPRIRNLNSQKNLKIAYDQLISEGAKNLYYLEGIKLLGEDGDDTVDNSHPNDLGFYRQANAFEEVLRPILFPKE